MISESALPQPDGMKQLLRPMLVVTMFAMAGQAVGFVTQVTIAALFGAGADMDAFLAANTLPQYVTAVLLSALSFVFIPVFVDYAATGREDEAWQVASGVISLCLLVLGGLAVGGLFFAGPLLRLTTPGLTPESLGLAARVARITWPAIVVTGMFSLLTGIYQAQGRFGWPAAVPVIGALVNLSVVLALARWLGVIGLAIAAASSVVLQAVLLLRIGLGPGRYRPVLNWRHPGMQQVIRLLMPLVISGLLIRCAPVVERYLASDLAEGSISHLGYAVKLLGVVVILVSAGIPTVVFPRMALNVAGGDMGGLKHTMSLGLRVMWLAVAPAIALGGALALPLVTAVFRRGQFSAADAEVVAGLLRVYLLALVGMSLGNITGRGFYVLKDTRTPAVMGVFEALAYAVYTALLARRFGVVGIAWGYVLYFDLSLLWHVFVIRFKTGNAGGRTVLGSFARTGFAAVLGGATAWAVTVMTSNLWLQLLLGGVLALAVYAVALLGLGSAEARMIWGMVADRIKLAGSGAPVAAGME